MDRSDVLGSDYDWVGDAPMATSFGEYKSWIMRLSVAGCYLPVANVPAV